MKSILIYINTANHPIYQKDTIALLEGYGRMIDRYGLNITIHTVCGFTPGKEDYIEDTVMDVDEHNIAEINFKALERFINEPYDIIVKTNTNTVINLQLLQLFCDSEWFKEDAVYSNIIHYPDPWLHEDYPENITGILFPSGAFLMASKQIWAEIVNHKNDALEFADKWFRNDYTLSHTDASKKGSSMYWVGYCDDLLYGLCLRAAGITYMITPCLNSTISQDKLNNLTDIVGSAIMDDISEKYLVINCKTDDAAMMPTEFGSNEEYFRIHYEHHMITAICRMFEFYNPTEEDVYTLGWKIYFFK